MPSSVSAISPPTTATIIENMEAAGHHSQAARINRAISEAGFDIDALLSPEPASRPRTDLGNAERLIDQYGADLRYCPPLGGWFVWDGRRWRKDDAKQVYRLAYETVRGIYAEAALLTDRQEREDMSRWAVQSEAKHRIDAMIWLAQGFVPAAPEEFDANPWLLNVENGTLDLRSGELRPHCRANMLTKLAPTAYDPDATAPTFDKSLERVQPDPETREMLQRAVGYSLTGMTGEECMFVAYGSGRNGKGKFFGIILDTLGRDYAQEMPPHTLMMKRSVGGASPELADLKGVRFAATQETAEGGRLDEAIVKQMTGGDMIRARQLNSPYVEFKPTHTLWMATNHKPVIRGTDEGIWSRIKLIPFTVYIPEEERDRELTDKLRAERAGVLAWAVRGCLAWQADGLGVSAAVEQATAEYREAMDWLGGFLEDRCDVGEGFEEQATILYNTYKDWAERNGERVVNQRAFGLALTERGFDHRRETAGPLKGKMFRTGLKLSDGKPARQRNGQELWMAGPGMIRRRPPRCRRDARPSPPCRSGLRHAPARPGGGR